MFNIFISSLYIIGIKNGDEIDLLNVIFASVFIGIGVFFVGMGVCFPGKLIEEDFDTRSIVRSGASMGLKVASENKDLLLDAKS